MAIMLEQKYEVKGTFVTVGNEMSHDKQTQHSRHKRCHSDPLAEHITKTEPGLNKISWADLEDDEECMSMVPTEDTLTRSRVTSMTSMSDSFQTVSSDNASAGSEDGDWAHIENACEELLNSPTEKEKAADKPSMTEAQAWNWQMPVMQQGWDEWGNPTMYQVVPMAGDGSLVPMAGDGSPMWGYNSQWNCIDPSELQAQADALKIAAAQHEAAARYAKAAAKMSRNREKQLARVPKPQPTMASSEAQDTTDDQDHDHTTIMLRNLPNDLTRYMLLTIMDAQGFCGRYDFVYLPMDFRRWAGLGYAFVNMVSHEDAVRAKACFQGFNEWNVPSKKVCEVCWGNPLQGLEKHVQRYRNSPVMHPHVPDECKPVVFSHGIRAEFPKPTRKMQAPRFKAPDMNAEGEWKSDDGSDWDSFLIGH